MVSAFLQSILINANPYRAYQAGRDGCGGDPCAGVLIMVAFVAIYYGLKNRKK